MPFARPSLSELTAQAEAEVGTRLGLGPLLRRSILRVLARVMAGLTHSAHGHVAWGADQILPDTASAEFLERHASLRGVGRRAATFATGTVTFAGNDGAFVAAGVRLQRADGATFETTAEGTVALGTLALPVTALAPGAAGNSTAGTALSLTSPVLGVDNQATSGAIEGGVDVESDDELRRRVLEVWASRPQAGTEEDYERWAREVAGITRAYALGGVPTLGQVTVLVVADDDPAGPAPPQALLDAVQAYIDERRPVTARTTVRAPTFVPIDIVASVSPNTAAVRADAEANLAQVIRDVSEPGAILRVSKLSEAISGSAGEDHHQITSPAVDQLAGPDSLFVLGTVTWF